MKKILLTLFCIVSLVVGYQGAMAQGVTTATIAGVIKDNTGAALPGATIIALHTPSGTQYGTATLSDGSFNIPNVRIGGPYKVTASFVGFEEKVQENVFLSIGQVYNTTFVMKEGGIELTEIQVTADKSDILNSDRTGAATNISNEQITRLPTLSRSFADFTRLTPQAGGQFGSIGGRNGGYNNVTIDGAIFNNSFGLSSSIGGQTNAQPVSLDAIDQIQVSIAPYDVRQGSFTGASINAVTRSGDNEFKGSVFYFTRNQDLLGDKVGTLENKLPNFKLNNYGFRVGGPIIKNKLFFFVNGEIERRDDPPSPNFVADRNASEPNTNGITSNVLASDLDALSDFLIENFNYNPGPYEGYQLKQDSDKFTVKLDWNINKNHRFNIKYNYLKSYRDVPPSGSGSLTNGRSPSITGLPFLSAYYRINNNLNSVIAELNSSFGAKISNTFQMGFTFMRDFRESSAGNFPLVDIGNGTTSLGGGTSTLTTFGYEPFSANNILNTDVFQISDNFTVYLPKHTITVGTYNEFYKFQNGFAPQYYGQYVFSTLQDFYDSANAYLNNPNDPAAASAGFKGNRYQLRYTSQAGQPFPLVETRAAQLGFYVQDEFAVSKNFKLTGGVRVDIPIIDSDIAENKDVTAMTFANGEKINTSKLQESSLLWSPRIGFNWDVKGDKTTQVRGGTGIFTGRVPFVWISNQASNNGVLFGAVDFNNTTSKNNGIYFSPNVDQFRSQFQGASARYDIAVTEQNFKFPQIWRSNIAIDQLLPGGVILTAEFAFTKDVNAVYHVNANLPNATSFANGLGDTRPRYISNKINDAPNNAIVMKNTDSGYSYFATVQLQKSFTNGFYATLAYNYSEAKSINDGGSIAASIWRDRPVSGNTNAIDLGFSNYMVRHRVVASASYRKEYAKFFGTSISLFYTAQPNDRFSYLYSGDMNGDNAGGNNDLIYIPRNRSEITLVDFTANATSGTYTASEQWRDLNNYITQDKYLNANRGKYAERNGGVTPWYSQIDLRFLQDFFINVKGKKNTLQFSLDIFNFGNLLNSKWGITKFVNRNALVNFNNYSTGGNYTVDGVATAVPSGTPTFTYRLLSGTPNSNPIPLTTSYRDNTGTSSRWQMQVGVRYIFN